MATGDLTTLVNVKQYLGLASAGDDGLLTRLITEASQYIQSWTNRTFASAAYVEKRNGTGGLSMSPRFYPVSAIASLYIDNVLIPFATDPTQVGYRYDQERIVLSNYTFNKGMQNVIINYTAGYASTPPEIEQACIDLVANIYRAKDRIGVSSKSLGGETVTFTTAAFTDSIKQILNNYRQVCST